MKIGGEQFQKLALEQLDMLYRIACRLTRSPQQAEDLVQETYLRALNNKDSFDLQQFGIRPWLLRIMHNLHVSRSDREKRQPQSMEEAQLEHGRNERGSPLIRGFDGMDQRLVRAMDELAPEYQTVLILWAIDELSYKEIAAALQIPIGTVMSRLHRARQRLAEQLHDFAVQERIIRE